MEYRTEFVYFTSCVFLVIISDMKGYAQQRQAAEGPVMAAQIGFGGYNSNMSWEELQQRHRKIEEQLSENVRIWQNNEEIARRLEQERQEWIRENRRRQQQYAQEERQRERERQRKQQEEWNRQNERNRLIRFGKLVECTRKDSYSGSNKYDCRDGLKCCTYDPSGCCTGFQVFLSYWYIWLLIIVLILASCVCCVVKNSSKKETPITTVPTVASATTTSHTNTSTTSNAGRSTTVHTTTTYYGNYSGTGHGFDVHVDDPASFLLSSTSRSRHQSGDSNHRSRNQSGRNTPANTTAYQDIPTGGTVSDAPPSYFDAVYKGVGRRTDTPTMGENQSSDGYHDSSAPDVSAYSSSLPAYSDGTAPYNGNFNDAPSTYNDASASCDASGGCDSGGCDYSGGGDSSYND